MKIVCPNCQTAYDVDLPSGAQKKITARCVRCKSLFRVNRSAAPMEAERAAQPEPPDRQPENAAAIEDEPFQEETAFNPANGNDSQSFFTDEDEEEDLNDFLDRFGDSETDNGDSIPKIFEDTAAPPQNGDSHDESPADPPQAAEEFSNEDLDSLLDAIISEELETPLSESTETAPAAQEPPDPESIDDLLNDLIAEEDSDFTGETSKPVPETATEETELEDTAPAEQEEAAAAFTGPDLEEATADSFDELLDEEPETEPVSEETADAPPEHADSEIADSKADSKEEDDPAEALAAAFAEQEEEDAALEETKQEEPPAAETQEAEEPASEDAGPAEETSEAAEPAADAAETENEEEMSDEDLWAQAFADQEATEQAETQPEEAAEPTADSAEPAAETENEEEMSDEDLWAQAFADQEATEQAETQPEETEQAAEPAAEAAEPAAETENEEEMSDEDLWAQAFADQEATEQADAQPEETEQAAEPAAEATQPAAEAETSEEDEQPEATEAADTEEEEDAESDDFDAIGAEDEEGGKQDDGDWDEMQEGYDQYDDDDDEIEDIKPRGKRIGPFTLPATKTGKMILAGSVVALLLTAGGGYFVLQTLAPSELTQMGKESAAVPDGLTPKTDAALTDPAETADTDPAPQPAAGAPAPDPAEVPGVAETAPAASSPAAAPEPEPELNPALLAALAPKDNAVQINTILPVAYNVNDIRVLSFELEMELSDARSAKVVREALPLFEKITINTVEKLLEKKFFNDVLYVKEKLKKDLRTNFNKTIEGGGRVKNIDFKNFTIQ